jgi:hypothetical protein
LDEDEADLIQRKLDSANPHSTVSKPVVNNYQSYKNEHKKKSKSKTPAKKRINKTPPPKRNLKKKRKDSKNITDFSTNKGSFKSK